MHVSSIEELSTAAIPDQAFLDLVPRIADSTLEIVPDWVIVTSR